MALTLPERSAFRWVHGQKGAGGQRSEVPTECVVGAGPWGGLSQEVAFGLRSGSPERGRPFQPRSQAREVASFFQLADPMPSPRQHPKSGLRGSQASAATLHPQRRIVSLLRL